MKGQEILLYIEFNCHVKSSPGAFGINAVLTKVVISPQNSDSCKQIGREKVGLGNSEIPQNAMIFSQKEMFQITCWFIVVFLGAYFWFPKSE